MTATVVTGDNYTLYCGDCLDVLPMLEAGSVNACITDPPYFRIVPEQWDKQWRTIEAYQAWIEKWAIKLQRVVVDNGSIYVFTDDKIGAYVQVMLDKHFLLLNNLVWFKTNNQSIKAACNLRCYAPMTERILFYTPQYDSTGWQSVKLDVNNFEPLREYFRDYQAAIGKSKKEIIDTIGQSADHCFRWNSTQWDLPTPETYQELGETFDTNGFIRREYEDLRREYEDLRRTWHTDGNSLDVIRGPIVSQADNSMHPTTKPKWIMKKFIGHSTNADDTILDPFMGSGTTGAAAMLTGRRFVGIEIDPDYFAIAHRRIEDAARQARGEWKPLQDDRMHDDLPLFRA